MSFDINVYCAGSKIPSDTEWQKAIEQSGAPISFKEAFIFSEVSGWLPCTYDGSDSGFEIYIGTLSDADREELGLESFCDFDVSLSAASDDFSLDTAVWAAAALANLTGGVLVDCQSGDEFRGEEALEWAQSVIDEFVEEEGVEEPEGESPFSEVARELINSAINNAFDIITEGEALDPFVRSYENGEAYDYSLAADILEEAIEKGVELVQSFPATVSAYALVYLGEIELEQSLTDSVIVEVGERGSELAYVVVQPFAVVENDEGQTLEVLGDAFVLNEIENILL